MAFLSKIGKFKYYLMAILNSDLIYFWCKCNVHQYGDSGFRLSNQYVENICIPIPTNEELQYINDLFLNKINDQEFEKEVNQFVYTIYSINENEKEFIYQLI